MTPELTPDAREIVRWAVVAVVPLLLAVRHHAWVVSAARGLVASLEPSADRETPSPAPTPTTEAAYLPGDYAALERLEARSVRNANSLMAEGLAGVRSVFMYRPSDSDPAEVAEP